METSVFESRMIRLFDRFRKLDITRVHAPLNPGEFHLLSIICRAEEGGVRVSELAERTGLPMPAVSRLMRGMEAHGLITRSIAPHDRRSILVAATEEGRAQHDAAERAMHDFMSGVFMSMTEDELERLASSMDSYLDRVEEQLARWKKSKEESD